MSSRVEDSVVLYRGVVVEQPVREEQFVDAIQRSAEPVSRIQDMYCGGTPIAIGAK
jgi:hypothetical protein